MLWIRRLGLLALLVCLPVLGGCGGGAAPLQPVSGKVSFRKMAVQTGVIVFIPDAARGNNGPLAVAEIRADGTYNLKTGEATGAAPGWYRVTIASVSTFATPAAAQSFRIPQSLLPEKYRDPELSQLACEVKAKANVIDFDLE